MAETATTSIDERPVWRRCWCWQMGRCLVDCPTADLPRPVPMTDENWKRAYMEATGRRLYPLGENGSPRVRTLRCTLCSKPDDDHDPSPCYGGGWVHENGRSEP